MKVNIKRVYEKPDKADGMRVLVDRIWPRGLSKEKAAVDLWLKDIAPSSTLRQWFNHDPEKWKEFKRRYKAELKANQEPMLALKAFIKKGPATLVYGAKNETFNQAVLLKELLAKA